MIFAILLLSSRSPRDVNSNLRFGTKLPKLENLPIISDFYLFLWVLGGSKYGWTDFEVSKQMAIGRSYVLKSCSGAANSQCSGHFESCSTFTIGTNKVWIWIKKNYAFLFIFNVSSCFPTRKPIRKKRIEAVKAKERNDRPSRQQRLPLPPFQAGSYPLQPKVLMDGFRTKITKDDCQELHRSNEIPPSKGN